MCEREKQRESETQREKEPILDFCLLFYYIDPTCSKTWCHEPKDTRPVNSEPPKETGTQLGGYRADGQLKITGGRVWQDPSLALPMVDIGFQVPTVSLN